MTAARKPTASEIERLRKIEEEHIAREKARDLIRKKNKDRLEKMRQEKAKLGLAKSYIYMPEKLGPAMREACAPLETMDHEKVKNIIQAIAVLTGGGTGVFMPTKPGETIRSVNAMLIDPNEMELFAAWKKSQEFISDDADYKPTYKPGAPDADLIANLNKNSPENL
ncbi:hypothetical protein SAE02_61000 [Skermanella aerolata]|uniref:Uncharacterized protein n=1 Tax=Skermanella aerolata TaxID=393310 RepID=A0A512DZS8_9PROT|nr:hypothetical protein [Skermanella aerolata]KJB91947.1 hypothetical protein N826_25860 [Skermanella aerolata KACC 11604]GEO41952.1 hypothetical protein SAE02_61000 [Skermanella aerolata]